MLVFVWHTGSVVEIDGGGSAAHSAKSIVLAFILRSVLTGWMMLDIGCGVWAFKKMVRLKKEAEKIGRGAS